MHGNYRQHYLLSSAASPAPSSLAAKTQQRGQQQQQALANSGSSNSNNFNGLPDSSQVSPTGKIGVDNNSMHMSVSQNLHLSLANRQHQQQMFLLSAGKQQQQPNRPMRQHQQTLRDSSDCGCQVNDNANCCSTEQQHRQVRASMSRKYYTPNDPDQVESREARHQHQQPQQHSKPQISSHSNNNHVALGKQQVAASNRAPGDSHRKLTNQADVAAENGHQLREDQYASQLRNSNNQFNYRTQPPQQQHSNFQHNFHEALRRSTPPQMTGSQGAGSVGHSLSRAAGSPTTSSKTRAPAEPQKSPLHVNFNRAGQSSAPDDDDDGDSRKKKYLTAKYGQQQMNLIKKRLKIEMWLYEQLQELAKGSKSEAELDEIDVDLDQLLDMDDDETRRHWLRKTLSPFEDLSSDRIDKFIGDVLEQAKLL